MKCILSSSCFCCILCFVHFTPILPTWGHPLFCLLCYSAYCTIFCETTPCLYLCLQQSLVQCDLWYFLPVCPFFLTADTTPQSNSFLAESFLPVVNADTTPQSNSFLAGSFLPVVNADTTPQSNSFLAESFLPVVNADTTPQSNSFLAGSFLPVVTADITPQSNFLLWHVPPSMQLWFRDTLQQLFTTQYVIYVSK